MTLGSALSQSRLSNGGHVLAVFDCVDGHWKESITCSGHKSRRLTDDAVTTTPNVTLNATNLASLGFYTCYSDDSSRSYPVERMFTYLKDVSKKGSAGGRLYSMQALWQETKTTVEIGELYLSSNLLDEQKSKLNQQVTDAVKQGPTGMFPHLNLVEVNNVCDGGNDLLAALRAYAAEYVRVTALASSVVLV